MPERGITEILNRQQTHTYGCAVVLTRRISHLISRPCLALGPTHAALRGEERHHLQRSTGFSSCTLDARLRPSTYHQLSIIIPSRLIWGDRTMAFTRAMTHAPVHFDYCQNTRG